MLMSQQVAFCLRRAGDPHFLVENSLGQLGVDLLFIILKILLPFLALNFIIALGTQLVQHGFKPMAKPMTPKFDRLNPFPGFKRLFSARAGVELGKSVLKFLILAWIAYLVLHPRLPAILSTMNYPIGQSLRILQETLFLLFRNVMIAMLVLALLDFLYQRHNFEKSIRMTKQEVKDEMKDAEGSPEIKGRQRNIMFSSMLRRIITQVPKAAVVITNPTHFAVALKYDSTTLAPLCVAKGVDNLALKIKERASVTGVPVVENPPLARALYRSVELDKPIPPELYQAVAQVLAFIYRLKGVA